MNNIKYILLLPLILISGCVHRQNIFEPYETQVLLNERYILSLNSGNVNPIDTINQNILYHVYFNKVKGGDTKLFGRWTLTEGNGYNAKRLLIKKGTGIVHSVSILELKNNNQPVIDLNEFVVH
jgi:hypothetical protein